MSPDRIRCIGVGSAGPLDLKDGSIVHSANLGFDRVPLIRPLRALSRLDAQPESLAN